MSSGEGRPADVVLPADIRSAVVAHARAEYPNEACGLIVGDQPAAEGASATRFEPTRNRRRQVRRRCVGRPRVAPLRRHAERS